jgi:hypothetical protein
MVDQRKRVANRRVEKLQLYTVWRCQRRKEGWLHSRFKHLRLHGEWFRRAPELVAVIDEISKDGFL